MLLCFQRLRATAFRLTIHAFVSRLSEVAAAVVAQAVGPTDAGGVRSAGVCVWRGEKVTQHLFY